jgi:hypothetical protein
VRQARLGFVTLFAIAEDNPGTTLRPRLQAAGMTPELEHLIRVVTLENARGEGAAPPAGARRAAPRLDQRYAPAGETPYWLSIDPIGSYLGRGLNN